MHVVLFYTKRVTTFLSTKKLFKNRMVFRIQTKTKISYTYSTLFNPKNYLIEYYITTIDLFYRTPFINFFSSLWVL